MGTDASHGNLWEQARWAAEGGLSPRQVMAALTSTGAALLGLQKEIGSLEPGKQADIVVFEAILLRTLPPMSAFAL